MAQTAGSSASLRARLLSEQTREGPVRLRVSQRCPKEWQLVEHFDDRFLEEAQK